MFAPVGNGRTIFNAIFEHEESTRLARFPPRRYRPTRRLSAKFGDLFVSLIEDSLLLFESHRYWILVRIAMKSSRAMSHFQCVGLIEFDATYISCPASLTIAHSSGKVSREWPGMKNVVLMSYLAKSFSSLRTPTVPAKMPLHVNLASSKLCTCILTSRYVARGIFASVRSQPTGDSVDINRDAAKGICQGQPRATIGDKLVSLFSGMMRLLVDGDVPNGWEKYASQRSTRCPIVHCAFRLQSQNYLTLLTHLNFLPVAYQ